MCAIALGAIGEEDVPSFRTAERLFAPSLAREKYDGLYAKYRSAVARALLKE